MENKIVGIVIVCTCVRAWNHRASANPPPVLLVLIRQLCLIYSAIIKHATLA